MSARSRAFPWWGERRKPRPWPPCPPISFEPMLGPLDWSRELADIDRTVEESALSFGDFTVPVLICSTPASRHVAEALYGLGVRLRMHAGRMR